MISTVGFNEAASKSGIRSDEACELRQELLIKLNESPHGCLDTQSSNFGEALDHTLRKIGTGKNFVMSSAIRLVSKM